MVGSVGAASSPEQGSDLEDESSRGGYQINGRDSKSQRSGKKLFRQAIPTFLSLFPYLLSGDEDNPSQGYLKAKGPCMTCPSSRHTGSWEVAIFRSLIA